MEFFQAVFDYLMMCEMQYKMPETAFKGSFNVRLDPELHRNIVLKAKEENMTLNAFVKEALKKAVT